MALKHDVVISDDMFESLCKDREAVEAYKKSGKFTHHRIYYSMGYTLEITTSETIYDSLVDQLNKTQEAMYQLRRENDKLRADSKEKGFFKRLFS